MLSQTFVAFGHFYIIGQYEYIPNLRRSNSIFESKLVLFFVPLLHHATRGR
eukprot:COSAG03_NODE_940_length_5258_cov_1.998255_2_plen_51_part_00